MYSSHQPTSTGPLDDPATWAILAADHSIVDRFHDEDEAEQALPDYGPGHRVEFVADPGTI